MSAETPTLEQFSHHTVEKLRYRDTDRQGHVNNAVFVTMLETGRAEVAYDPIHPLYGPGCSFVIASLTLNFLAEIGWPGRVDIGTRVSRIGSSSFGLEQGLFQNGRCVATASTVIVQMNDATRKSQPLPDHAIARLKELMVRD